MGELLKVKSVNEALRSVANAYPSGFSDKVTNVTDVDDLQVKIDAAADVSTAQDPVYVKIAGENEVSPSVDPLTCSLLTSDDDIADGVILQRDLPEYPRSLRPTVAYPGKLITAHVDDCRKTWVQLETGTLLDDCAVTTGWVLDTDVATATVTRTAGIGDAIGVTPNGVRFSVGADYTGTFATKELATPLDLTATPYNFLAMWCYSEVGAFASIDVGICDNATFDSGTATWFPLWPRDWVDKWDLRIAELTAAIRTSVGTVRSVGFRLNTAAGSAFSFRVDDIRANYTGKHPIAYAAGKGVPLTFSAVNTLLGTSGFMDVDDLRRIHTCYGVQIASHSYTHGISPYYAPYTAAECLRDTLQSRAELEDVGVTAASHEKLEGTWPAKFAPMVEAFVQPGWGRYKTADTGQLANMNSAAKGLNNFGSAVRRFYEYSRGSCRQTLPGMAHFGGYTGTSAAALSAFIGSSPYAVAPAQDICVVFHAFDVEPDATYYPTAGLRITHKLYSEFVDAVQTWRDAGKMYPVTFSTYLSCTRGGNTADVMPLLAWGDCDGLANADFQSGAATKHWSTVGTGCALTSGNGGYGDTGEGIAITGNNTTLFFTNLPVIAQRRYVGSMQISGTGLLNVGLRAYWGSGATDFVTAVLTKAVAGSAFAKVWFTFSTERWADAAGGPVSLQLRRNGDASGNIVVDDLRLMEV